MEKLVWESNKTIIDKNFNYMIDNYYNDFEFKYLWDTNPIIEDYLKRLFISSFIDSESIRYDLPELIHDIEDYIATAISDKIFTDSNIDYIFDKLKYSLNSIIFDDNYLHMYKNNTIILSSDINSFNKNIKDLNISIEDYRRSYLYFEISKLLIDLDTDPSKDKFMYYLNKFSTDRSMLFDPSLIEDGIDMLNIALSQNLGEHILFKSLNMNRPKYRVIMEDNYPVVTNFIENGLYQKVSVDAGRTVTSTTNSNDYITLINMTKVAFETSLLDTIRVEYSRSDSRIKDLISLFQYYGMLYRSKNDKNGIFKLDYKKLFKEIDNIKEKNKIIFTNTNNKISKEEYLNA